MQFKRYQAKRRQSLRPPTKAVAHEAKMEANTTNRNDFVSHTITPLPPKPVVTYKRPDGSMDGSSEYKEIYQGKWAVPVKPMRPPQTKGNTNDTFDYKSTHTMEYVVHTLQPREGYGPKYAYETPKERFEGTSTGHSDYVDFGDVQPPKSLKPQQKSNTSEQRFEGLSSYRSSYAAHAIPAKFQRPKEVYTRSEKTFYGNTTNKSDFQAYLGTKPATSLKPTQPKISSGQAFEDKTTSRMSYTKWEIPSKVSRPPTVYMPPSETFAAHTTYKGDFPVYDQFAKAKSFKPNQKREDLAPFQGVTSHDVDYKAWRDVQKLASIRLEKKYSPPSNKFDATSTFKAHFTGEFGARASSTKPQLQAYTKSCAMEESTSYRDSFSGYGYVPCPASSLVVDVNQNAGYNYSHEDSVSGHKFFSPAKDAVPKIAVETVA